MTPQTHVEHRNGQVMMKRFLSNPVVLAILVIQQLASAAHAAGADVADCQNLYRPA